MSDDDLRPSGDRVRVLVVAPQPFRPDDVVGESARGDVDASIIRRPADLEVALDDAGPDVLVVWTDYPEGGGIDAIGRARALAPDVPVLALTPDPPPHDDVALATRAGAAGFVDAGATSAEVDGAIRALHRGGDWFPSSQTKALMTSVAGDLDTTRSERQSRLIGIAVGLVPITGAIAALLSLLYRSYLGQIGVRPVDIAIDPASRVVDAISAIFFVLGFFGPLLFVGTWLSMLRESAFGRGPLGRLVARPRTAKAVLSLLLLVAASLLTLGFDLILVLFVGPLVAIALLARALDLDDELPRALRLERISPRRAILGGVVALGLFIAGLSVEALIIGPQFGSDGAEGYLMPQTIGFKATPMRVLDVDSGRERELLYLGGNADLYVLVDPCEDDAVLYVSVGATRLLVIDEVTC